MIFQKLNIPNGQSTLAGLVRYQSWTVTIQKNLDCHQSVFYKKKIRFIFYILNK